MTRSAFVFFFCLISQTGCTHLFYHPTHGVHFPPEMVNAKPVPLLIPAKDGSFISAWKFLPEGQKPKSYILFFHGNAENLTSHYLNFLWILKHGYGFIIFDYRGYGASEFKNESQSPSEASTVEDGMSILNWAQKELSSYVVYGQSLGGAIAISSLGESGVRPKLAVIDSAFDSYKKAASDALSRSWITWAFQWLGYITVSDEKAPIKQIRNIPSPLLFIHGSDDHVVGLERGLSLYNSAVGPKEFWEIPEGSHGDVFWRHDGFYRAQFVRKLDTIFLENQTFESSKVLYEFPFKGEFEVLQSSDGEFSHQGALKYAVDFKMPDATPVFAMRSGRVAAIRSDSDIGGPNLKTLKDSNFVVVDHGDGTKAEYYHLKKNSVRVKVGEKVTPNVQIALSGSTGFTSEPHLHVMVYRVLGDARNLSPTDFKEKQSLPIAFRGAPLRLTYKEKCLR